MAVGRGNAAPIFDLARRVGERVKRQFRCFGAVFRPKIFVVERGVEIDFVVRARVFET